MPWATYLNPADLPPRPDPETGLPRPPHAPRFSGSKTRKELDTYRSTTLADCPPPPPGQPRVLVWYKSSQRGGFMTAAGGVAAIVVLLTVGSGFRVDWMCWWWSWLLIALGMVGIYFSERKTELSVGAEWLRQGKTSWVRLYELTRVTAHPRHIRLELRMTDADGRKVEINVDELQRDRDIWDLVYNGILHSVVAGGAHTNGMLHRALSLPYPK